MSRPCSRCVKHLHKYRNDIKTVYWSTKGGNIEKCKSCNILKLKTHQSTGDRGYTNHPS